MFLDEKVALVTGASRGIGAAIATELAKRGAIVVGTATSDEGAQRITDRFKELGLNGRGMKLDVTQQEAVEHVLSNIQSEFGYLSVLVNNAGVTRDNLMIRMSEDEWGTVLETNLSAIYRIIKACLRPMMKARWGRIINIGSVVGSTGNPGQVNYCAAKAGLIGLGKALAREVARKGVTINSVSPGFIATDMTNKLTEDQQQMITAAIPMRRIGQPDNVAHAVAFLASPYADYITGETIHVNGGMYMA